MKKTDLPPGAPERAVAYETAEREFWVRCDLEHVHYGEHGAAGLLMRHRGALLSQTRYYLQKRPPWADHGSTYSIPGGALHADESPREGALREAEEEIGNLPPYRPAYAYADEHGGWAYHTVVVDVSDQFTPEGDKGYEHIDGGWYTEVEIKNLPLHPGFSATWYQVREAGV